MSSINQVASDLYKAISESDKRKVQPYDVKATVLREEGNVVWVKIPGGVDETPVQKTNNANIGDDVMVRISGGRAWLLGNETSPATDDATAVMATQIAEGADGLAKAASNAAVEARESADVARAEALRATNLANDVNNMAIRTAQVASDALASAQEADAHALKANSYAMAAGYQLSEVEKVVDVLTWISQHGTYKQTDDETIVEGKWYFELVSGSYVVGSPTSNPKTEGFYELDNVDAAISNYISTHLYLDTDGLHIQSDSSRAHILITGTSIYLVNEYGIPIAQYSDSVILGDPNSSHIELSSTYGLSFYQTTKIEENGVPINRVAYVQNDRLFIESATLTNSLQIGNFRWVVLDHRISLKYNPIN